MYDDISAVNPGVFIACRFLISAGQYSWMPGQRSENRLANQSAQPSWIIPEDKNRPFVTSGPPVHANATCNPITALTLTLLFVDCTQEKVWATLQASGQFPDVFFSPGKTTQICYKSSGPTSAFIGQHQVTITSTLSGWTTDFVPALFGGHDNLGTVVTQLAIVDQSGNYTGKLFTRDTIDLSQIATSPTATEEDVIVGGTNNLGSAKGTYRVDSTPNDPEAMSVTLTNLHGVLCTNN